LGEAEAVRKLKESLDLLRSEKGSFWWRNNLKLLDSFKRMAMVNILDGASCLYGRTYETIEFLNNISLNPSPLL
jgi:hypothetical protein